jgi:hypothetical protein
MSGMDNIDLDRKEMARRCRYHVMLILALNEAHGVRPDTLSDIGTLAGLTKQAVGHAFRVGSPPTIQRIADALGVEFGDLLGPIPEMPQRMLDRDWSKVPQEKLAKLHREPRRKRLPVKTGEKRKGRLVKASKFSEIMAKAKAALNAPIL